MTVPLSYLAFHVLFILPPIICLGWLAFSRTGAVWGTEPLLGLFVLVTLAVVYTTPWDNHLIDVGVWWYGEGAIAETIWHAPIGEYLFFVLQPILTGFWLFQFSRFRRRLTERLLQLSWTLRVAGFGFGFAVSAIGWLWVGESSTFYLGAILLWAGPILAIQWAFGLSALWDVRRTVGIAVLVPTVYLWVVDRIAIGLGIWQISEHYTTGYALAGLPIEEALFFLVTNVFVVQGLVLYLWVLDRRHELRSLVPIRNRPSAIDREGSRQP
ncbi:lycopene cyclase domain-containing protein [Natrialbaceae archaeon A-arb3/5]